MKQEHHWTSAAIECYKRGCICKDCAIQELFSEKCKMKLAVLKLLKILGKPKEKGE